MKFRIDLSRRRFLRHAGYGVLAAATFPARLSAAPGRASRKANPGFIADVEIELSARKSQARIFSGAATRVWRYEARLVKGPEKTVDRIEGSYLGPILRLQTGQRIRIWFRNELPASSVTHWHGLHVPAAMDGHPMDAIDSGESLVYEFEIRNRAGTYWFHPHPHADTARQVYFGLAGLLIVNDEEEQSLGLPGSEYDIPLVFQDRTFDSENRLRYLNHPMQTMTGFLGDRILVNGRPDFALEVAARSYRLRLLNGSNSRIFKLAWDDRSPLTVIGTDGGLIERAVTRDFVMLAPGERIELWVDFGDRRIGSEMKLQSLPFSGTGHAMHGAMGGHGMGRGMRSGGMGAMGSSALPVGSAYEVMKVRIVRKARDQSPLPERLLSRTRLRIERAANPRNPRPIALSMHHRRPQINGRSYETDHLLEMERIPVNTLQLFEIFHRPGMGMMMTMPHPIHLHGQQFEVIERTIDSAHAQDYETVRAGYVDEGLKDTVLVMPGESVRILKPFDDFRGRFMYHCHNLEHEDEGMMRDFFVK